MERIVANWTAEKRAAPNVAAAIRLMDAVLTGNTDYVRENYPLLVEALQKSKKRKATLSPKESDSYTERESEPENPEVERLAEAIDRITGKDRHLNPDVHDLADDLYKANYTASDVDVWYARCWPTSWPGNKGDTPTLKLIRERIGQVRSLPPDEPEPELELDPLPNAFAKPWPPEGCSVPQRILMNWDAVKSQTQIRAGRHLYDHWIRPARPVHYDSALGTLYVAVPSQYEKDWIEKNWLRSLQQEITTILPMNYSLTGIQIIVKGDPIPMEQLKARTLEQAERSRQRTPGIHQGNALATGPLS